MEEPLVRVHEPGVFLAGDFVKRLEDGRRGRVSDIHLPHLVVEFNDRPGIKQPFEPWLFEHDVQTVKLVTGNFAMKVPKPEPPEVVTIGKPQNMGHGNITKFVFSGHPGWMDQGCWNCRHMQPSPTGGGGWCHEPSNRLQNNAAALTNTPSVSDTGHCNRWAMAIKPQEG